MQVRETGYTADREDLTEGEDPFLMWVEEFYDLYDGFVPVAEVPEVGEGDGEEEPF